MKRLLFALFLLLPTCIFAQELDATVQINMEKLPNVNKDLLVNFKQQIEQYLNNNHFSNGSWEGERIKCTFSIFFQSAADESHYSAQIYVASQRPIFRSTKSSLMLSILDNTWDFAFEKNQPLYAKKTTFNALTSFLDFYVFLILGLDADSYNPLDGNEFFNSAIRISQEGQVSGSKGWDKNSNIFSRRGLVDELLDERFRQFREDFFNYHYNGLDLYTTKKLKSQETMARLIYDLDAMRKKQNFTSVLLKTFFDAKVGEIIDNLKDYQDKTIFDMLKRIDPPHSSKYEEALK